ncbi:MAG TPA: bL35 family ribosomal protein [Candidatus Heimdallarchaeota archaeon]|nr:bL35 family ribosomal protein [Candidatus Heimdallarchaeota archaeon]
MPKQKTHRGANKRFKKSKSGKLFHHMSNYFHKNIKKRSKAKRQARQDKQLTGGQAKAIKRMIGS